MNDRTQPVSQFKSKSGVKRIFSAFFYSIDGFRAAWKNEHAFRQEVALVVPGIALEPTTGEVHLRHHISPTGFYRGRKVIKTKTEA